MLSSELAGGSKVRKGLGYVVGTFDKIEVR